MKHNQETFPILQEADSVCTALFIYYRHSSLRTKSLRNAQSMLGLKKTKFRNMIKQLIMENLMRIDIKSPDMLTNDILEECVNRLKSRLDDKAASGQSRLPYRS